jgi:chromosome partitioning protein
MSKIVTILNQKGGVGKTTNTINIGSYLSLMGFKVLMIDLDTQCDLGKGTGSMTDVNFDIIDFLNPKNTKEIVFKKREETDKQPGYYVLPGNEDFNSNNYKKNALKNAIINNGFDDFFDYILIDVPPTKIMADYVSAAELAIYASTNYITCIRASSFSVENLNSFLGVISAYIKTNNLKTTYTGMFFNDVLVSTSLFNHYKEIIGEEAEELLFKSFIRRDEEIEKANYQGYSIFSINKNCRGAWDFAKLTDELIYKLNE